MSDFSRQELPPLNWSGRVLAWICARPLSVLLTGLVATVFCAVLAITSLQFKSDRADLISPEAAFHQRWLEYCERFHETNELVVLLQSPHHQDRAEAVEWVQTELKARDETFEDAIALDGQPNRDLSQAALTEQIRSLQGEMQLAQSIAQATKEKSPLQHLLRISQQELMNGPAANSEESAELTTRIAYSLSHSLGKIDHSYEEYFPNDAEKERQEFWSRYLQIPQAPPEASEDNKTSQSLISVIPRRHEKDGDQKYGQALETLHEIVAAGRQRFPGVNIGVTGIPQLEYEEMAQSQHDMVLASVLSAIAVLLLLLFGYRGIVMPTICCLTVGICMIWTLGATTLLIGHLNILSMAFAAILVGLGIDFGIHLLSSYQSERQAGRDVPQALILAGNHVGRGIITAALTTSIAFLCAGFTDFPGVAELGMIAGIGVLLAVIATGVIFPTLVLLSSRVTNPRETSFSSPSAGNSSPDPLGVHSRRWMVTYPGKTLLLATIPVIAFGSQLWKLQEGDFKFQVDYDANLLNMQPRNLPALKTRDALSQQGEGDVLYAVNWYDTREQAIDYASRFRELETVGEVIELASEEDFAFPHTGDPGEMPIPGADRPITLNQALETAVSMDGPPLSDLPHNPAEVGQLLEQILKLLQNSESVINTQFRLEIDHFLDVFAKQPFEIQIQILSAAEKDLVRSLWSEIRWMAIDLRNRLSLHELQWRSVSDRLRSRQGDWLVQIRPRIDVWDDEGLARFVHELRSVDPNVTGTPIQNYEASRQLKQSYLTAAAYASLAIVLLLLFDVSQPRTLVRSWLLAGFLLFLLFATRQFVGGPDLPELTPLRLLFALTAIVLFLTVLAEGKHCLIGLLALLPPAVGTVMLLGVMALCDISFTPANLIALPLVLGIGIDDGVHVIHDFRRQKTRYMLSANTSRALVLTTLTSMAGFGSLMFAAHRGLAGLGLVVVTGIAGCLFVSVIILPAVLAGLFRDDAAVEAGVADDGFEGEFSNQRDAHAA